MFIIIVISNTIILYIRFYKYRPACYFSKRVVHGLAAIMALVANVYRQNGAWVEGGGVFPSRSRRKTSCDWTLRGQNVRGSKRGWLLQSMQRSVYWVTSQVDDAVHPIVSSVLDKPSTSRYRNFSIFIDSYCNSLFWCSLKFTQNRSCKSLFQKSHTYLLDVTLIIF